MIKKLIGLVVALAVLAGLVMYNKSSGNKSRQSSIAVDPSLRDLVHTIHVRKGNDTALVSKKEGEWVTGEKDWPADTSLINKVLEAIFKLEDKEVVSRNPERASEYGLDTASVTVIALYGAAENELYKANIGKTSSADYNSTYWKKIKGDLVYRTPGNFKSQLKTKDQDWMNKKLYYFKKDEVRKMVVFWLDSAGGRTEFTVQVTADGNWEMLAPKSGGAKKSLVETMAGRFEQLSIDEFPDEGDAPKMNQSPSLEVRATLTDGNVHQLSAQKAEKHFYLKHPTREEIVKLNKWRLEVFEKSIDDLYEPLPEDSAAVPAPE